MAKRVHLVRHGHHALLSGVLCGRMPGVELDELGRRQMAACLDCIPDRIAAIQCSPQRRAQQSASILAWHLGLPVEIVPAVDEIDFGTWTGRSFGDLDQDPDWKLWNKRRGTSRPPDGESMQCLQRRVVQHIESLRADLQDGAVLVVSHAEPIRAALLHYAGIALDNFLAVAVDPASVSTLRVGRTGVHISRINQRAAA
jgi:broad specificity phosphatase PhoE